MKTDEIISSKELVKIISAYGAGYVSVDGEMPYEYETAKALELDGSEKFKVVVNYAHPVEFHLISDDMRAIVTTGLTGRVEKMEWVA